MTTYTTPKPAGQDWRDIERGALAALPSPPSVGPQDIGTDVLVAYDNGVTLTAPQLAAWQAAVAATTADPNAPWRVRDVIDQRLVDAVAKLRVIRTRIATGKTTAQTVAAQGNYATANLANLNSLLGHVKSLATLVGGTGNASILDGLDEYALDLLGIAHLLSGQLDSAS